MKEKKTKQAVEQPPHQLRKVNLRWVKTFSQMGCLLGLLDTASQTKNIHSLRKEKE